MTVENLWDLSGLGPCFGYTRTSLQPGLESTWHQTDLAGCLTYRDWDDMLQSLEQQDSPPRLLQIFPVHITDIGPQLLVCGLMFVERKRGCAPAMGGAVEDAEQDVNLRITA